MVTKTAFLFADVVSFDEVTDMLHITIPMTEDDARLPGDCLNDDLDSDDSRIALHFFQALTGQYIDGPLMVGQRFKLIAPAR